MSETGRIAIIGEKDLCFPLRASGLAVFCPASAEEARMMLAEVVDEKFALCLIHEKWLEPLKAEIAELSRKFAPVCVGFSDYRAISESVEKLMRDLSIKATGSESLFTRGRNNDETR
jgi:vacuolar-type H+-ATPase subunit F/Vma7